MIVISLLFILFQYTVNAQCPQCTLASGLCSVNQGPGTLCKECEYRGYYSSIIGQCVCTSSEFDPTANCTSPSNITSTTVTLNVTLSNANCSCYTNYTYGFWKPSTPPDSSLILFKPGQPPAFKYGLADPPVCNACWNQNYGMFNVFLLRMHRLNGLQV